jgi:hypothetical protein
MPRHLHVTWGERLAVGGALFLVICTGIYARGKLWVPHITCESASMDLGIITSEEPLDCLFSIRNSGHAELQISNVKTGCACTAVPFYQERLAPGESTVVPVRLDVKGRHGALKQLVILTTNDPTHGQFPLRLTAEVQIENINVARGGSLP